MTRDKVTRDKQIKIFVCGDESFCWLAIWIVNRGKLHQYVHFPWRPNGKGTVSECSLYRARILSFHLVEQSAAETRANRPDELLWHQMWD